MDEGESDSTGCSLFCLTGSAKVKPFEVTVMVDSIPLQMEIDTGATSSLIAESTFKDLWPVRKLESKVRLSSYTGEQIPVLGSTRVKVEYKKMSQTLTLIVVAGSGPSLLGRDWVSWIGRN